MIVRNINRNITGMSKNDIHKFLNDNMKMPLLEVGGANRILETLNYMESKFSHLNFLLYYYSSVLFFNNKWLKFL